MSVGGAHCGVTSTISRKRLTQRIPASLYAVSVVALMVVLDLLRIRVPVRGVLHPDRHVRRDYHGDVLLPALQRRLPLVRAGFIYNLLTMANEWS